MSQSGSHRGIAVGAAAQTRRWTPGHQDDCLTGVGFLGADEEA